MALTRRSGNRFQASIWPGFVDAMTALLLVLMFVLTIFMVVQFMLGETIAGQETELTELNAELAALAEALGLEQQHSFQLEAEVGQLGGELDTARIQAEAQSALIATLTSQLDARASDLATARARITDFEAQVASLLSQRDAARNRGLALEEQLATLEEDRSRLLTEQEQLQLALAQARDEVDAQAEAARLAAARREALEALIADLRRGADEAGQANAALSDRIGALENQLSEEEAARLAEAAAAQALRDRLKGAEDELTAMTLALEEQRRRAEETLTMLAAAQAAERDLDARLAAAVLARTQLSEDLAAASQEQEGLAEALARAEAELEALRGTSGDAGDIQRQLAAALAAKLAAEQVAQERLSEAEERAVLLASANRALDEEQAKSAESQRKLALLNQQVAALRAQLGSLQALLDESAARNSDANVQIETLSSRLNAALVQVTAEQRARAELEAAERKRLEEEARRLAETAKNLENFRSEFFGRLREVLAGREGVRIVGDRFVFSSEVLFESASAELSAGGQAQIANVVEILRDVSDEIPAGIDWIIRVDGHTDNVPLLGTGKYRDNWELSQGRALAVVRYMTDALGFPPERLAATGFGEYQPVNSENTSEARAQNRRIELKLTER
ncbi:MULTISPECIES: peptidoglycan -binding protein [Actibacterium]|uniref:Chemotaxis protein MotB n=1 Tax=Actibacterium naphthalenivorans TaxID=1614693 RepID=A0A840C7K4_9RHOB|nr:MULTISPECIES: peptidoglycan -binding protein [Actibacterium]ALG89331.1 flagellar motor protein [Actibacterium sp. EMB200-NS6]MBB4021060.1 chemotaxis protein MotB [Actibacterium naphthalenivorans]